MDVQGLAGEVLVGSPECEDEGHTCHHDDGDFVVGSKAHLALWHPHSLLPCTLLSSMYPSSISMIPFLLSSVPLPNR